MKSTARTVVLYALMLVPIAAVSFAAKSALKLGGKNGLKIENGKILAGEGASHGAGWTRKEKVGTV